MKRFITATLCFALPYGSYAEEVQALKEVTVTATGADVAERREASTQKIVLNRKDIEGMSALTVNEVLERLPGVELGNGGMGQKTRGMVRDSVQVLVDGERSAGSGTFIGVVGRLPSGEIERVEILRGSSAEFGGGASVTVNLVMKKHTSKAKTEVRAGVGMRNNIAYGQLSWAPSGNNGGFSWSFPVNLLWSNSPIDKALDRQDANSGVRTLWQQEHESGRMRLGHHSISPRLSWKDGADSLTLLPMYFWGPSDTRTENSMSRYAAPASGSGLESNGSRTTQTDAYSRLKRLRLEGEKHMGDMKLTSRAALNGSNRSSDTTRTAYSAANVMTVSNDHTDRAEKEYNLALRMDRPVGEAHLLAVGLEHIHLKRDEDQVYSNTTNAYQASERQSVLWLQDDWMFTPKMTLTYGLRGETVSLAASGTAQDHARLLPSIALKWELSERWLLRTSLGAGMKMPKLDEIINAAVLSISTNTPVEADSRGNPNLAPEHSINYEAVLERYLDGEAGVMGANLYVRSTDNFIERRVQLEGTRWVDRPQNEGRALHWGLELDGKIRMDGYGWKGTTLKSHLTLPNSKVEDSRLGIIRNARETPNFIWSAGLDGGFPSLKSSYGLNMHLSGRSRTDVPGEQMGETAARTTLDAFWLYQMSPELKLRLTGQNLLQAKIVRDMTYMQGSNTWKVRTEDQGYRSIMCTLEGRW